MLFIFIGFLSSCTFRIDKTNSDEEDKRLEKLVTASFPSIQQYILKPKCVRCHDKATTKNHYIDLSSYEKILNSPVFPPLIVPGYPDNSSLYTSILKGSMPKEGAKLSSHLMKMIKLWIENGAPKAGFGDGGEKPPGKDPEPPSSCDIDEPGCEDACTEPDEQGCKPPSGGGCEPDEPGCDEPLGELLNLNKINKQQES